MSLFNNRFIGTLPAGDVFNFGFWISGAGTVQQANNAALAWMTFIWGGGGAGAYGAMSSTETSWEKTTTYQVDPVTFKSTAIAEFDASIPGTGTGQPLPQQNCVVVSLRSLDPSRRGRGRFFLPAPTSAHLSSTGGFADADRTALGNALATAFDGVLGGGFVPIVNSRKGLTQVPITRFGIGKVFETQTRRTNKLDRDYDFSSI